MRRYAVILAGGKGERFWPLSTPERPKPFLRLFGSKSLLLATGERLLGITLVARKDRVEDLKRVLRMLREEGV